MLYFYGWLSWYLILDVPVEVDDPPELLEY
jgi:hypothetical protein